MDAVLAFPPLAAAASTGSAPCGCNPARLCHELTEVDERHPFVKRRKATQNAKDAPELRPTFPSRGTIDVP
jgi:hypothetical protein